jgi:hypothetical protein
MRSVVVVLPASMCAMIPMLRTGFIGQVYEDAAAGPKGGFYLETLGAVLLLASGGLMLALPAPGAPAPRVRRRERPAETEA